MKQKIKFKLTLKFGRSIYRPIHLQLMYMYDEMQVVLETDQATGEDAREGIELANEAEIEGIGCDETDADIDNDALTPVFISDGTQLVPTQSKATSSTSMKKMAIRQNLMMSF
uniref:Uncharacterized protein n=1 Tax=Nelumbo nucifera TaxID=4432 RepID=A0A822ZVV6_NELNU|nr:TPA_asm: hypothetical protein HUJ06_016963 [Nelumbo nucifera]